MTFRQFIVGLSLGLLAIGAGATAWNGAYGNEPIKNGWYERYDRTDVIEPLWECLCGDGEFRVIVLVDTFLVVIAPPGFEQTIGRYFYVGEP